jgi:hypothetical protein
MRNRRFGLLASFLILGFCAPAQAQILKVLTLNFNAEPVPEDHGYALRDPRLAGIVDWIEQNDPDIVAIEEGWNYRDSPSVIKTLAEAVGYDYTYRISMGAPLVLYSSEGILAKKKFNLSQREDFELAHSAPWIGDGKTWVVIFGGVSWSVGARLTLDDGSPLYAFSGHLVGSDQSQRDDQIAGMDQSARRKVAENDEDWDQARVLLMGDFNSSPGSPGTSRLAAAGYHDTFGEAHPGLDLCTNCTDPNGYLFNPMTLGPGQFPAQDAAGPGTRIDYVWARGPGISTLASTLTFTAPVNGVWMSDHYGVTSWISVGDDASAPPPPNAIVDSQDPPGPTTVLNVTDELMSCDTPHCIHDLPDQQVSAARGVTVTNGSKTSLRVECDSPAHVYPRNWADLDPGQTASFFYTPGADYSIVVTKKSYLRVRTVVHAQ